MSTVGLDSRLSEVRSRIATAAARSGRDGAAVTLLAVTKGHPVADIAAAAAAGLRDIGESRVQEARAKRLVIDGAPRDGEGTALRWHLVGHLQHNKARLAAAVFDVVQSIDSQRIAAAIAAHRPEAAPLTVLLEVELTGIPGRSGVTVAAADGMVEALGVLPHIRLAGLMTVAAPGAADGARGTFARLRELRDALRGRHGLGLDELSMGMSDDFEVAVEEGATLVRLGRVLFGERSS